jgi:hypothetical protein
MDDLTARLIALLRLHAAALDQPIDDQLSEQFRKDLQSLITEYGPEAVNEALNDFPEGMWPSISLH